MLFARRSRQGSSQRRSLDSSESPKRMFGKRWQRVRRGCDAAEKGAELMSDDALLNRAAQLIADARVECLKLAIPPSEIAKIMMDEAVLALMAESQSLSDIQDAFKRYGKRELSRF